MHPTRSHILLRSALLPLALLLMAVTGSGVVGQVPESGDGAANSLAERIVGTWELVSYKVEDKETGQLIDAMGSTPRGRAIFTRDGWVAFNLEGSDRKPASTDAERARLLTSLVAYIGRYRIEGDQWVTSVQTAWTPDWVGTEQRRTIRIDGDYADVTTPWRVMPNWNAGRPAASSGSSVRLDEPAADCPGAHHPLRRRQPATVPTRPARSPAMIACRVVIVQSTSGSRFDRRTALR